MKCAPELVELMHKVIDEEADAQERRQLLTHLKTCQACKRHFEELRYTATMMQNAPRPKVPDHFTANVLARLPKEKPSTSIRRWFHLHPLATAAAIFLLFMTSYFASVWSGPQKVSVMGEGNVQQTEQTVIVPEGETIKGDLVVRNSDLKIEGTVEGNVTLINGKKLMASAGQVTGEIEEVNQVIEWIWYEMKQLFSGIFHVQYSLHR